MSVSEQEQLRIARTVTRRSTYFLVVLILLLGFSISALTPDDTSIDSASQPAQAAEIIQKEKDRRLEKAGECAPGVTCSTEAAKPESVVCPGSTSTVQKKCAIQKAIADRQVAIGVGGAPAPQMDVTYNADACKVRTQYGSGDCYKGASRQCPTVQAYMIGGKPGGCFWANCETKCGTQQQQSDQQKEKDFEDDLKNISEELQDDPLVSSRSLGEDFNFPNGDPFNDPNVPDWIEEAMRERGFSRVSGVTEGGWINHRTGQKISDSQAQSFLAQHGITASAPTGRGVYDFPSDVGNFGSRGWPTTPQTPVSTPRPVGSPNPTNQGGFPGYNPGASNPFSGNPSSPFQSFQSPNTFQGGTPRSFAQQFAGGGGFGDFLNRITGREPITYQTPEGKQVTFVPTTGQVIIPQPSPHFRSIQEIASEVAADTQGQNLARVDHFAQTLSRVGGPGANSPLETENRSFGRIQDLIVEDEAIRALRKAEELGKQAKNSVFCRPNEESADCQARREQKQEEVERQTFVEELQDRAIPEPALQHFLAVYDGWVRPSPAPATRATSTLGALFEQEQDPFAAYEYQTGGTNFVLWALESAAEATKTVVNTVANAFVRLFGGDTENSEPAALPPAPAPAVQSDDAGGIDDFLTETFPEEEFDPTPPTDFVLPEGVVLPGVPGGGPTGAPGSILE